MTDKERIQKLESAVHDLQLRLARHTHNMFTGTYMEKTTRQMEDTDDGHRKDKDA